jgi:uncharacterized protein YkwD
MPRLRRLLAGLLLSGVLFALSVPMEPAGAGVSNEQENVRLMVNHTRDNNNLRGMARGPAISNDRAQNWARHLVACQCLEHRTGAFGATPGWCAAAENVGRGWSLEQIHRAFLGSPPHRQNMLTGRFTHLSTGVAKDAGGEIFVVQAYEDRP